MRALDAGRILGPCPGDTTSYRPGEAAHVGDATGSSASRAPNKRDVPHRKEHRDDRHLRRPGHRSHCAPTSGANSLRRDRPAYDEARRVRNGLIDRRPALIARCSGTADVVAAVNFAREHDLLLSVRGGGHNVAGNAINDGGLVIDLSAMRGVRVDPGGAHRARAGRRHLGRRRPRDPALRPGHAGRRRLHDRRRRADPARRLGLAAAQVRLLRRQPPLRRHRHRRRPGAHARARRRTPTSSGRSAAPAATSGSSPPSSSGCTRSGRWSPWPRPFYALEDAERVLPAWRDFMDGGPDEVSSSALFWGVPAAEAFPAELHGRAIAGPGGGLRRPTRRRASGCCGRCGSWRRRCST